MDIAELIVTACGAILIAFVVWFFFGSKKATAAKRGTGGVQEIEVSVGGVYTPDRIEVEAGRPVRLIFVRHEASTCTAEVVLPDFSMVRELPVGRRVTIEFTPTKVGEYPAERESGVRHSNRRSSPTQLKNHFSISVHTISL